MIYFYCWIRYIIGFVLTCSTYKNKPWQMTRVEQDMCTWNSSSCYVVYRLVTLLRIFDFWVRLYLCYLPYLFNRGVWFLKVYTNQSIKIGCLVKVSAIYRTRKPLTLEIKIEYVRYKLRKLNDQFLCRKRKHLV